MTDIYKTPSSSVNIPDFIEDLNAFKRVSVWRMVFLTIVTLGVYPIYWMYTRTQILNSITSQGISSSVIRIALVSGGVYLLSPILGQYLVGHQFAAAMKLFAVASYIVFTLIWLFGLRAEITRIARNQGQSDFHANGVLTYFFQMLYLQYKINQFFDRQENHDR
ncbi:DUF4234 domain-containing protein [Gynuella sunshinyii]|uniref:DUF4234 domain-containing protein n=1 Tax=Gynuella sunshinyii YC6258 TaxID=1445510 RepID=A0A0C5VUQ6_9GAMM|nr:DUF4234 domain-containing protein [Gynuella sunshinyii]AJQ97881.1 hypothetical Protein YC6258_05853 [Gynuella sunshinyii YC6258]